METIASVENMEDVSSALSFGVENAAESVRETGTSLDSLSEAADAALAGAEQAVEEARAEVCRLESLIESLESEISSRSNDEEGEGNGSAEAALTSARADLGDETEALRGCEERREKAAETARQAAALRERFLEGSRTSLMRMEALGEQCAERVRHACEALEKYIAEHPGSAAAFAGWVRWTPPANAPVTPDALAARMKAANFRESIAYEAERDPRFRSKIEDYQHRWTAAATLSEKAAVIRQARRNASGELAERVVTAAFRPIGDVSTQNRTVFDDGRYTKTDLVVRNLRAPVILGRGDRAFAPKGGTAAFEVKAGKAFYLQSQEEHLVFQAGGHRAADASATICTADIHDLPEDEERRLRDRLRAAGSPIIGMLPRKRDIDRALYEAIVYGIGKERP